MEKVDEVEKVRTCWYRRELRVARMLLGVVMLLGASLEHSLLRLCSGEGDIGGCGGDGGAGYERTEVAVSSPRDGRGLGASNAPGEVGELSTSWRVRPFGEFRPHIVWVECALITSPSHHRGTPLPLTPTSVLSHPPGSRRQ